MEPAPAIEVGQLFRAERYAGAALAIAAAIAGLAGEIASLRIRPCAGGAVRFSPAPMSMAWAVPCTPGQGIAGRTTDTANVPLPSAPT
ncbi:hypothetical protein [Dyella sp.]|uniref:hypothetical protein n=1 Tax=Dyella sp. TaxID=1869338 RepID=UPI002D79FC15|nr:hypothetical protein [Dyella sp.]HET7330963.1 hypothetical protein [Dyella sp.]